MKFKNIHLRLLAILGLTGCNLSADKEIGVQIKTTTSTDKEIFSLYQKTDSTFRVVRALTTNTSLFDLHFYEVNVSIPEEAKQTFTSVQHLTKEQLETRKVELQNDYKWTPFEDNDVLFVQLKPTGFKNEMELLDARQNTEEKLSNVLENKKLGDWFAGDLGPGGGNMLYSVTDIEKSLQAVLEVLRQNKLDKNVLIGRRVKIDKNDWFYEVIYPLMFTGDFNTM